MAGVHTEAMALLHPGDVEELKHSTFLRFTLWILDSNISFTPHEQTAKHNPQLHLAPGRQTRLSALTRSRHLHVLYHLSSNCNMSLI